MSELRRAAELWRLGTLYTHEHFVPEPGKFVGHTPAQEHREAEAVLVAALPALLDVVEAARSMADIYKHMPPRSTPSAVVSIRDALSRLEQP